MKLLKLAALLGVMTTAGNAATIVVTQGFGSMGLLVTNDGITQVPFVWAVGNYAEGVWTQFSHAVPDTFKVNGSVTAQEPASLNNQVIHLWVGAGAVGTEADFTTPWVILRTNTNVTFPPDVAVAGGTTFNASYGSALALVAAGNGGEWLPETTDTAGGNIILVPESSTALLGLAGLLALAHRRRR